MAKKLAVSERRWMDSQGERYMNDGVTVRCQASSKSKLDKLREEYGNPDLTSEDLWPQSQCAKPAVEGTFLCQYHGGAAPQIEKKSIIDFMPMDFREIVQVFRENPELIDNYLEMAQLVARNAKLYEAMQVNAGGPNAWLRIRDAVGYITSTGDVERGLEDIREALDDIKNERELWDELRTNMDMLKGLRTTQFKIEKDLKTMATIEQVRGLIDRIYDIIVRSAEREIEDEGTRRRLLASITAQIRGAGNFRT